MKLIAFSPPDISQDEIDEVADTLKSGWITTGPKTKLFEDEIAAYCHTQKAAALSSATAGMELTLRLLGVGEDDEVITTAYTYTASASIIAHVGAKIVLLDTGRESFHIDYDAIASAITDRTKVIIPVDIAGLMCDYDRIYEIVESKRHLFRAKSELQRAFGRVVIMADAAHSFGAIRKGKRSGQAADFTVFSFHAVKNLTTAEGGAVTWKKAAGLSDEEIYRYYMLACLHGQSKDALAKSRAGAWEYDIVEPLYKCNMNDVLASIGLAQLRRYPRILERRRQLIDGYDSRLAQLGIKSLKHYTEEYSSSGHLYMIRLPGLDEEGRNIFIEKLAKQGISANVHFKPLPMLTAYKKLGFDMKDYPNAYEMYKNEITLPLHTRLSDEDVDYVCEVIKNLWSDSKGRRMT